MGRRVIVKLQRSLIGHPEQQRRTVLALGLRRRGASVEHTDSPEIRGMIAKVRHLVAVEEAE
jgi:large subunit ribosomal protein L30